MRKNKKGQGRKTPWPAKLSPRATPQRFGKVGDALKEDVPRLKDLARLVAHRPQLWAAIDKAINNQTEGTMDNVEIVLSATESGTIVIEAVRYRDGCVIAKSSCIISQEYADIMPEYVFLKNLLCVAEKVRSAKNATPPAPPDSPQ